VGTSAVSMPAILTDPDEGLSNPLSSLVSVVLPAPFWPTMPTTSPGYTHMSRLSTVEAAVGVAKAHVLEAHHGLRPLGVGRGWLPRAREPARKPVAPSVTCHGASLPPGQPPGAPPPRTR
jgi:hypothetical protein